MALWVFVAGMFVACLSCSSRAVTPIGPGSIVNLETQATGLSGLTRDGQGALWAVSDHGDWILHIDPRTFETRSYAVLGTPDGTDLEALVWMGGDRFLIGTETQEPGRATDLLMDGVIDGERFRVRPRERFGYGLWGLVASGNHGIEGLCRAGGFIVLATELLDERGGRRQAPLAILDLESGTWTPHRLALTTKTGKLSAIGCRLIDGDVVALAVERHFGVTRLLRFRIPRGNTSAPIEPEVAVDLSKQIQPLPNFEGIVWNEDGSIVLLTDNYYKGRVTEPSRLFLLPASILP